MPNKISIINIFYLICIVVIGLVIISQCFGPTSYDKSLKLCQQYYNEELKGRIVNAYIDKNNKYFFTYVLVSEGDTITRINETSNYVMNLHTLLHIGDSLYKPKHSFDNYIFKKGNPDSLLFRKGVDCVCGDSIPPDCAERIKNLKQF